MISADASIVRSNRGYLLDLAGDPWGNLGISNMERRYSRGLFPPSFETTMKDVYKPTPVQKITCSRCGELMMKIYPYSSIRIDPAPGVVVPPCKLCQSKNDKK